jgi:hypothetical protein
MIDKDIAPAVLDAIDRQLREYRNQESRADLRRLMDRLTPAEREEWNRTGRLTPPVATEAR